jgi:YbbR domain-containing protein
MRNEKFTKFICNFFFFSQLNASEFEKKTDRGFSESSFYDPFVENLPVSAYLNKLKAGELIGKDVPNGKSPVNLKRKRK